jgi:phosphonate transport system ATP-binding protein
MVLADEPIASLDPHNARKVMEALRRMNQEDGITVLCNLHHLDSARAYCDRIVGMAKGAVVFDGAPSELNAEKVREIYGADENDEELEAAIGSSYPVRDEDLDREPTFATA